MTTMINLNSPNDIVLDKHGLIEASAGTGKTYTIENLVVRFILEKQLDISQFLIVTFTEKATSELKTKIRSTLYERMKKATPAEKELLNKNLLAFDKAPIHTIHGFCNSVLTEYPFENNEYFNYKVVDSSLVVKKCRSDLISKDLLKVFGHNFSEIYSLIDFKKVQGLVKTWVDHPKYELYEVNADFDPLSLFEISKNVKQGFLATGNNQAFQEADLRAIFSSGTINRVSLKENVEDSIVNELDSFFSGNFLKLDWEVLNKLNPNKCFKKGYSASDFEYMQRIFGCISFIEPQVKQYTLALHAYCAKLLLEKIKVSLDDEGSMTFDRIVSKCRELVCEKENADSVVESLRDKYKVVMVDEFQDTDILQWDIFQRLFISDKTTLFLIGDPKQSIYKFRGADINVYNQAKETMQELTKEEKACIYNLDTNFRSYPELVSAFNHIFQVDKWFGANSKISYSPVKSSPDKAPHNPSNGYFRESGIKFIPLESGSIGKINRSYVEFMAKEILLLMNANKDLHFKDFCILVDKRKAHEKVTKIFDRFKIPAQLYKENGLKKSTEVIELDFILNAIYDAKNKAKLSCALMTPFFGCKAVDLKDILDDDLKNKKEWQLFHKWVNLLNELDFGQLAYSILFDSDLIQNCLKTFGGEKKLSVYQQILESFLHNSHSFSNATDFMEYWSDYKKSEESITSSDDDHYRIDGFSDKVTVMTMHVSKGLQYKYVFNFPSSGKMRRQPDAFWFHDKDKIKVASVVPAGFEDMIKEQDYEEYKRIQYVCFTRAIHSFYTPIGKKPRSISCNEYYKDICPQLEDIASKEGVAGFEILSTDIEVDKRENSHNEIPTEKPIQKNEILTAGNFYSKKVFIQSYSSLVQKSKSPHALEEKLTSLTFKDDENVDILPETENQIEGDGLKAGSRTGNMLHSIFENINFSYINDLNLSNVAFKDLLEDKYLKGFICPYLFDFDFTEKDYEMVLKVVWHTLTAKNFGFDKSFSLCQLSDESRKHEMEFDLGQISSEVPFLHGFIDLVFEWQGKYHILDWKSNLLPNYQQASMLKSVREHGYNLQAEIYFAAIIKWLAIYFRSDAYHKIGGVHYYFIRGAVLDQGVFSFDLNELEKLSELKTYL